MMSLILLVLLFTLSGFVDTPPEPVPLADEGENDIIHFLLLGSDTFNPNNAGRTDVILILGINRTASTVSFLSIPRDLYVYIPDFGVNRINTTYGQGEREYGDGGGARLLKETIVYNLGIEIDFYARVDFNGFKEIINAVGGVTIPVDCTIQDWRLREPDLDVTVEDNWEMFTLPVGLHHLDGDAALWYVRSRRTSSDFDRGRRQQDLLRALWTQINSIGISQQLPDIWQQVTSIVQTDITLPDMLGMFPIAVNIDSSRIQSFTMALNREVTIGLSPEGSSVLFPDREAIRDLVAGFMIPPTHRQTVRQNVTVEIVNGSGAGGLAHVAAARLMQEGFSTYVNPDPAAYREFTTIDDYTGQSKGGAVHTLRRLLHVGEQGVTTAPDPNRDYDYRVIIGGSYYACTYDVLPPRPVIEAKS